jgi:hypothetical protein
MSDSVIATAILDRLLHHAHVMNIRAIPTDSKTAEDPRHADTTANIPALADRRRLIGVLGHFSPAFFRSNQVGVDNVFV